MNRRMVAFLFFLLAQVNHGVFAETKLPVRILIVEDKFENFTNQMQDSAIHLSQHCISVDLYFFSGKKRDQLLQNGLQLYVEQLPPNLKAYDIIYCLSGAAGKKFIMYKNAFSSYAKLIVRLIGPELINSKNINKFLVSQTDLFLTDSDYIRYKAIMLGYDQKKVIVHYDGINHTKFPFRILLLQPGEIIKLVSICSLQEINGIQYAIRAIADGFIKQCPDKKIQYTIIGEGSKKQRLKKMVQDLKLKHIVKMTDSMSEKCIDKILHDSHILILPCVTTGQGAQEGVPDVLKIAMAKGVIVISTRSGGIPELIENDTTGFLAPERNMSGLSYDLRHVCRHVEKWPRIVLAAKEKVLDVFDYKKTNDILLKIFSALLKK